MHEPLTKTTEIEKLDSRTIDTFLAEQRLFLQANPTIDLRPISFISPSALVNLAATVHALAARGQRARLLLNDAPICSYLQRVRFIDAIADVADVDAGRLSGLFGISYIVPRGNNRMLIEVTKIESGKALPAILDKVVWVLRNRLKYGKFNAFDIATVISEVCQNTFDHNVATCGFLAMQVYGKGSKRFLEIGVSDFGDGLLPTLSRNPKNGHVDSDLKAIELATQLGTSQHDDPTRGTGLYHLLEVALRHAGTVQIWSGTAKVRFRMDRRKIWPFDVTEAPGVHLSLVLPAKAA